VIALVGPTAVGKTQCALTLAEHFDAELVGADSVQVYRGFDIGSSKPTPAELHGIAHHLIDVREPTDLLDAAGFATLADRAIAEVAQRGKLPVIVGGTGLWLRALLRGLVAVPAVDHALRTRLEYEWDEQGGAALHERLERVDPLSAARIHPNDKLRVVRALEVYEQTGQPLGAARQAHALGQPRYQCLLYVLDLPTDLHKQRVAMRVNAMLEAGFVAEVTGLLAKYDPELRPLGSVGYKQIVEHLRGGVSLDDTSTAIRRATLLYARRQRTWWSTDPSVSRRVSPDALRDGSLFDEIRAFSQLANR
jgi:tRNA dimethylallyltransferase